MNYFRITYTVSYRFDKTLSYSGVIEIDADTKEDAIAIFKKEHPEKTIREVIQVISIFINPLYLTNILHCIFI